MHTQQSSPFVKSHSSALTFAMNFYNMDFQSVWLGGTVVRELDLQLETAGSIPADALSRVTFGKLFRHICLCHQVV